MTNESGNDGRMPRRFAWIAAATVLVALAFLHGIGSGRLAAPPLTDPGAWSDWLAERDAVTASFSLIRVFGLGIGWYLAGTTALQLVARVARLGGLAAIADLLAVPMVRRLAAGLVGLGVSASMAPGAVEGAAPPRSTMERIADPGPNAVLRRLPDGEIMVALDDSDQDSAELERLPALPATQDRAVDSPEAWTVQPGDHLWSISEEVLADAWGRPPTDAETDLYWRSVLAANALPDPDLLFPGQVVVLPEPPSAP